MKKFFSEFKAFITRGNVIDMAVGVIVGGAFTAIVTALTNQIFQPLINWLLALGTGDGAGLEQAVTMLKEVKDATGAIDMTKSIYINWGAFITAVINFIMVAFILFCIVRTINRVHNTLTPKYYGYEKKEYFKMRRSGMSVKQIEEAAAARDKAAEDEKKRAEEEAAANAPETQEELLKQIRDLLMKNTESEKKE